MYKRQSGGKGQYGHCKIRMEPLEAGKGYEFVDETVGGSIPKEYIQPINNGIQEAAQNGPIAGYEVVDFKVTVYDGSYHEVDSSEMAFKIAGSLAFKEAVRKADPVLLEPMMKVEVTMPEEYLGDIMGNVSSRETAGHSMTATAKLSPYPPRNRISMQTAAPSRLSTRRHPPHDASGPGQV